MSWEADSKMENCKQKVHPEVVSETIRGENGVVVGGMRDSELDRGNTGAHSALGQFSGGSLNVRWSFRVNLK